MKKCPFCAEEIQDEAVFCKHCKHELNKPTEQVHNTTSPKPKKSIWSRWWFWLIVILGLYYWWLTIPAVAVIYVWLNTKLSTGKKVLVSIAAMVILVTGFMLYDSVKKENGTTTSSAPQPVAPATTSAAPEVSKEEAQKELKEIMDLGIKSKLVTSYEFSDKASVVYIGPVWYTQTVSFKKDLMAKIGMLKKAITGYTHFQVRDAYSNEKVGEITAFSQSIEIYK